MWPGNCLGCSRDSEGASVFAGNRLQRTQEPHGEQLGFSLALGVSSATRVPPQVLPIIVFFSCVMSVLYYVGLMQWVILKVLQRRPVPQTLLQLLQNLPLQQPCLAFPTKPQPLTHLSLGSFELKMGVHLGVEAALWALPQRVRSWGDAVGIEVAERGFWWRGRAGLGDLRGACAHLLALGAALFIPSLQIAWVMQVTMGTTATETLSVAGNIFVSQVGAVTPSLDCFGVTRLLLSQGRSVGQICFWARPCIPPSSTPRAHH